MLAWLSVCSEVQTCIWPSWCHWHSLSLAQHWYYSRTGCDGMGTCCEKKGHDWLKICMQHEVEVPRPRGRPKRTWRELVENDCQAHKLNKEDAMDCSRWRKLIKDVRWSGWVWVGECFSGYQPTRAIKRLCVVGISSLADCHISSFCL